MRKKYVIACSDQEKDCNYKYIFKEYHRNKKVGKNLIGHISLIVQSLRLSEPYYFFSEKLCELYIEEMELFYLNNNFHKQGLHIRKAYLIKKNEEHYAIFLPIFLSLFASIIYGIFSGSLVKRLSEILNAFYGISVMFFDLDNGELGYAYIEICKSYVELFTMVIGFILFMILLVAWIIIKIIHVISALIGGINFSITTIKQYEIDYVEKLVLKDEYFSLVKEIEEYSNQFSDVINLLVYNTIIKSGRALTKNIIDELNEKLIINPIIEQNDIFSTDLFEKQIIVKSIICRVLLKMSDKNSRLLLKGSKIILKNNKKHKEQSCYG